MILAAKTGIDYRKLKAGEITQAEFNRNIRQNTAAGIGSVLGGAAGIALGVPVGYYVYKKIGSIIGAIVFGIIGSEVGEYIFESAEESLENMLIGHKESNLQRCRSLLKRSRTLYSKESTLTEMTTSGQRKTSFKRLMTNSYETAALERLVKHNKSEVVGGFGGVGAGADKTTVEESKSQKTLTECSISPDKGGLSSPQKASGTPTS